MLRSFFVMLASAAFVLTWGSQSANLHAAPPAEFNPARYTQTLVTAAPNFSIVRVTHTTADMQPSVQCPAGYKVVGGGFDGSADALVYHSFKKHNGWKIKAKPYAAVWPNLTVYATCLQYAHSITYRRNSIVINSLQTDSIAARCAADEVAIGGGHKVNDNRALVYTSKPTVRRWYARARNQAADARRLVVLVICVPDLYANQSIASHGEQIPPSTTKSARQLCPHPMYSVMSGGFDAEDVYWRISSFPYDDNTWYVTMRNDHMPNTVNFTIYATCFEFT